MVGEYAAGSPPFNQTKKGTVMQKRTDYIVIQEPMISVLGLSGISLLVFAVIHGFTKDGEQHYRAFPEDLMKWTGASERSIKAVLKNLLERGFINRERIVFRGKSTFEYWTNYEELLDQVMEGKVICKLNIYGNAKSAETTPLAKVQKLHPKSAETAPVKVQKLHYKGAETAPEPIIKVDKHTSKHSSNYSFNCWARKTAPFSKEEEQEIFKIFFEKNAADPAAEVEKFVNFNESKGWEGADGRKFDTPMKRFSLARMWEIKSGANRLSADFGTAEQKKSQAAVNKAFLKMLGEIFDYAREVGDPANPTQLLNTSYRCRLNWNEDGSYDLIWSGTGLPSKWYTRHQEDADGIVRKHFQDMNAVVFNRTNA